MADDVRLRRQLKHRIENRRRDIEHYLTNTRPRRNLLTNVSIVSSALAASFTAGPAVAGPDFTKAVANALKLDSQAAVWRPLCLAAFVVALVAAISANLSRSHDLQGRVAAAEACDTELACLITMLDFRGLPLDEGVDLYQQYVHTIPFVPERAKVPAAH